MATVKLLGIYEKKNAIPAADLKPGMVTVWDFGYTETIKRIEPTKSGEFVKCVSILNEAGTECIRTMRNDRLVAIQEKEEQETINTIDKAIKERDRTHYGIYSDIGNVLDNFSTSELVNYFMKRFGDGLIRNFIEEQIIAAEIQTEQIEK